MSVCVSVFVRVADKGIHREVLSQIHSCYDGLDFFYHTTNFLIARPLSVRPSFA